MCLFRVSEVYILKGLKALGNAYRCPVFQHHLKKLDGRRLDFDYKKKRQGKVQDDEMKQALEKFDDSKEIAEQSMFNLLKSDLRKMSLCFDFCLNLLTGNP